MIGQGLYDALSWNAAFWTGLAAYSLACIGAGLLVMRLVGGPHNHESPSAFLALASLLGLGCLGQLWLLLALGGLLTRPIVYSIVAVMLIAAVVLGWPHGRMLLRALHDTRVELRRQRLGIRVLLLATLAWMLFTFTSLGRSFSGDSLALHMMIAKIAAATGTLEQFWFQPGNEYFGLLGEMTYAVLMQLGNDDAAQMSTWVVTF